MFGFCILMKIPSFLKCAKNVFNQCNLGEKSQNVLKMIKLFFSSFFIAHILACLFYLCSKTDSEQNWVKYFGIQNETPAKKYLISVYWAMTTMSTAGYNIITPQNDYEILFTIFSVFFGYGLYAYILTSIGLILKKTQKREMEFQNELRIINNFMNRKGIGRNLRKRVQESLNFAWLEQKSIKNEEEKRVINKLEERIKEEIVFESYGQIFLNCPVLMNNFSEQSLRKIAKIVREIKYIHDEEIFKVSDECSLYFITSGSFELLFKKEDKTKNSCLRVLKKGEIFGEICFFTGGRHSFSCVSREVSSVLIIDRQEAIKIFKENSDDYEKFCWIKDQILLSNCNSHLQKKCFQCSSTTHTIKNCPAIHYIPDYEKIVKSYNFYTELPRKNWIRKKPRKFPHFKIVSSAKQLQTSEKNMVIAFSGQLPQKSYCQYESFNTEDDDENSDEPEESDIKLESQDVLEKEYLNEKKKEVRDETEEEYKKNLKENIESEEKEHLKYLKEKAKKSKTLSLKDKELKDFFEIDESHNVPTETDVRRNSLLPQSSLLPYTSSYQPPCSRNKTESFLPSMFSSCQTLSLGKNIKEGNVFASIAHLSTIPKNSMATILLKTPTDTLADKNKEKTDKFQLTHEFEFDKIETFKNYYPEMNFAEVTNRYSKFGQLFKELHKTTIGDLENKNEIFAKLEKLGKYTIYVGKFRDLVMKNFIRKFKTNNSESYQKENKVFSDKKLENKKLSFNGIAKRSKSKEKNKISILRKKKKNIKK